jgi:hypothetical protein
VVLLLQDQSGLGEGIASAGSVLGQALAQRGQLAAKERQQSQLMDVLSKSRQEEGLPGDGEYSNEDIRQISIMNPILGKIIQQQKDSTDKGTVSRFKETAEIRKEIRSGAKAARDNNIRLEKMRTLNKSGKLVVPLYNDMLKKFGFDFAALKNPDSEEFEKLSNDMTKNIKDIFGSRVTNLDLEIFLKTIPTLSNTTEGREKIIENLQLFNKGSKLRNETMQEIIKENKGVPPYGLAEMIEERAAKGLDRITEEFLGKKPDEIKEPMGQTIEETGQTIEKEAQAFEKLPPAAQFDGKMIQDDKTGKRFKSVNGKWKVIK